MKLYYSPGACSQAVHIALHEAGVEHQSESVDLRVKRTASGADYWAINPKGAVPALDLGNGEVLTENAAILQYVGDLSPDDVLLPPVGDLKRYRVLEWLNFIATDLHKGFGPLWNPASSDDAKQAARDVLAKKFDFAEQRLGAGPYLMGEQLTVADPYLFAILGWTAMHGIDLGRWPGLVAFTKAMRGRESVRLVLQAEGLAGDEAAS
ncbi:MAG: glutathione transferase GstA [Sphingomonas sp.]|nr:glutathione transferase GstA [Sphingomonas sp.]